MACLFPGIHSEDTCFSVQNLLYKNQNEQNKKPRRYNCFRMNVILSYLTVCKKAGASCLHVLRFGRYTDTYIVFGKIRLLLFGECKGKFTHYPMSEKFLMITVCFPLYKNIALLLANRRSSLSILLSNNL